MADMPWDARGEAQAVLQRIVSDQRYGPAALSNPQTLTYVLQHALSDAPRESSVLIAASNAGVPGLLQHHLSQGRDLATACRLTAAGFETQTGMAPDACQWAVGAMAAALPLASQAARPQQVQDTVTYGHYQQATAPGPAPGAWPGIQPRASRPHRRNGIRLTAAALAVAGAGLVIWACALPDLKIPAGSGRESLSIFNSYGSGALWFAVEPVGAAAVAIIAALLIALASREARLRLIAAGMLIGLGFQTVLLFTGYEFSVSSPDHPGPAGAVGMIAGMVLLAAGLLGVFVRAEPAVT